MLSRNITLEGSKGKKDVTALFDSGATYSCIKSELAEQVEIITPLLEPMEFTTAKNGQTIIAKYAVRLNFYLDGYRFSDEFMLIDELPKDVIIGAKTLQAWRLKLDFEHDKIIFDPNVTKLWLI